MIHYAKFSGVQYSACGLCKYGYINSYLKIRKPHYLLKLTRTKSKVTCKNCRRTKCYQK